MVRAYSQDLRDRAIDAALSGAFARQAAARFGTGDATAIVWVRRARESGERQARKQSQPRRSKLDPHRDYLLALIEDTPDLTISELLDRLLAERRVRASRVGSCTAVEPPCASCIPVSGKGMFGLHDGLARLGPETARLGGLGPCG